MKTIRRVVAELLRTFSTYPFWFNNPEPDKPLRVVSRREFINEFMKDRWKHLDLIYLLRHWMFK